MPELPDVAGFQRYLEDHALGRRIARTSVPDARILGGLSEGKLARALKGRRLGSASRHGKHLFAALEGGGFLMLHFGMTGDLVSYEGDGEPPDHARVLLDFDDGSHLAYRSLRMLGRVELTEDRQRYVEEHDLGPDALEGDLDTDWLARELGSRRAAVKSVLMDQSVLAGIGNVYADEILRQAGIHPATRAERLDRERVRKLFRVMRRVLRTAARKGGDLEKLPGGWLLPRRDRAERCPRCGGHLRRQRVGGRTTVLCRHCQQQA